MGKSQNLRVFQKVLVWAVVLFIAMVSASVFFKKEYPTVNKSPDEVVDCTDSIEAWIKCYPSSDKGL